MKIIKEFLLIVFIVLIGAAEVIYAQPKIPKENIPSDIDDYVKQKIEKLYSGDPIDRGYAASELGKLGERAVPAIPFLIGMLGDDASLEWVTKYPSSGKVNEYTFTSPSSEAEKALVNIGNPAVEFLIVALKDEDSIVREKAVSALGEIKDPRAVEPLIDALTLKDSFSSVHEYVADALGKIKDPRAIEPLIAVLNDADVDPILSGSAIDALKEITGQDFRDDAGTVAKSSLSGSASIKGTILDPNNKNGIWEEVSSTEVRLKHDLKEDVFLEIAKYDFDIGKILQQSHAAKWQEWREKNRDKFHPN